MPLYTLRANLAMTGPDGRGSGVATMHHHFTSPTDGGATVALEEFTSRYKDDAIRSRWLVERGSGEPHELVVYRRSIENRSSWVRLGSTTFDLGDFVTYDTFVTIAGANIGIALQEHPLYPHRRGAVLVEQRGVDRSVRKRTYVGPISPIMLWGQLSVQVPVLPDPTPPAMFAVMGRDGDYPQMLDDTIDEWRSDIMNLARDHVAQIGQNQPSLTPVLVSWKRGIITPVGETRASPVRADIRNRGPRIGLGDPFIE